MNIFILIPLLIVIALLVSSLGSISGVGGGVLFVPLMLWILKDQTFDEIKFVSTLLVFTSALINVGLEIYHKRFSWSLILLIVLISVPTIFLGNYLASLIDQKIAQLIVVIILIIVTILLSFSGLIAKKKKVKVDVPIAKPWYYLKTKSGVTINIFKLILITFFGGLITTLTGMGGGPILMPLLILLCGLTMKQATPISHTIIAVTSFITLCLSYEMFGHQDLNLQITLPMVVGVIGGTTLAYFIKSKIKNEAIIKWILIALIWVSIIKMIVDLAQTW